MELPSVRNVLRDGQRKVVYEVFAYRALSREELIHAVGAYLGSTRKKPGRGETIKIISIIGANGE